jgi:hypothetical protein
VKKVMGHEETTYMFLRNRNGQKESPFLCRIGMVRGKALEE